MLQIFLLKSNKMLKLNFPQPKDLALIPILLCIANFSADFSCLKVDGFLMERFC